jgi:non-canonical poly(A) RNA polymerase PAPD5/7
MLAMRDLNEVFTGGLGGFSIICLVVSMLQLKPKSELRGTGSNPHYGRLLLNFLNLYGNEFDIRSTGIVMNPPRLYDKIRHPMRKQNAEMLTIIDPNNSSNDISGGSRQVHAVFDVFRKAHSQISQRMSKIMAGKDVGGSILGCVIGGNYTSFVHQRNRLYRLYSGEKMSALAEPLERAQGLGPARPQKSKKHKKGKDGNQDKPHKQLRSLDG